MTATRLKIDDTALFRDLGLESIDFVDLIFETEQLLIASWMSTNSFNSYTKLKIEDIQASIFQQFFDFCKNQLHEKMKSEALVIDYDLL